MASSFILHHYMKNIKILWFVMCTVSANLSIQDKDKTASLLKYNQYPTVSKTATSMLPSEIKLSLPETYTIPATSQLMSISDRTVSLPDHENTTSPDTPVVTHDSPIPLADNHPHATNTTSIIPSSNSDKPTTTRKMPSNRTQQDTSSFSSISGSYPEAKAPVEIPDMYIVLCVMGITMTYCIAIILLIFAVVFGKRLIRKSRNRDGPQVRHSAGRHYHDLRHYSEIVRHGDSQRCSENQSESVSNPVGRQTSFSAKDGTGHSMP